jgi:hypothetical protein
MQVKIYVTKISLPQKTRKVSRYLTQKIYELQPPRK